MTGRQQPGRRVQELGAGLLRQGAAPRRRSTGAARPDAMGRGRTTNRRPAPTADEGRMRGRGSEDYDVIIIGSGAGGGTLAGHLAPSGKRILILERGDWLPREIENWDSDEVFVNNRYVSDETWYDEQGQGVPAGHPLLRSGARRSSMARRSIACGREDFGELRHHDGISPAWPISYDDIRALVLARRAALRGPRQPRRGPDRGPSASARIHSRPCPRAADPAALGRSRAGRAITRSTRRAACGCSRATCPTASASDARRATASRALVHGQVRRGDFRRPARAQAPERDAPDQRPGDEAHDERRGDRRRRRRGRAGG